MKLEAERRARDEAILAECSFTPMVRNGSGFAEKHPSSSLDTSQSPTRLTYPLDMGHIIPLTAVCI